jgi:hypothetical protein
MVGIAVENNMGVGTGTLVLVNGERFIFTAEHVIRGCKPADIRFWMRPSAPIKEKAAADLQIPEIARLTLGVQLPIVDISANKRTGIAALKLDPSFVLPEAADVYDIGHSREFMSWEDKKIDTLSIVLVGYPVANFKELFAEGNRSFRYLGCASHLSEYSVELNNTAWSRLGSEYSQSKDFVLKYFGFSDDDFVNPKGFSGGAVWVLGEHPGRTVWSPAPIFVGVVHDYAPQSDLLIATELPALIEAQTVPPKATV